MKNNQLMQHLQRFQQALAQQKIQSSSGDSQKIEKPKQEKLTKKTTKKVKKK